MPPALAGFDHVHVYVKDREAAARWYGEVMGFAVMPELAFWADHPQGPLTIADPGGTIHLALFARDEFEPSTAIAFRANAADFLAWKARLEARGVLLRCTDHSVAWSVYFTDLDGNMHEITTYDHAEVTRALSAGQTARGG